MSRQIALLTHSSRPDAQEIGVELTRTFESKGVKVVKLTEEETLSDEIEMLLVLGAMEQFCEHRKNLLTLKFLF